MPWNMLPPAGLKFFVLFCFVLLFHVLIAPYMFPTGFTLKQKCLTYVSPLCF